VVVQVVRLEIFHREVEVSEALAAEVLAVEVPAEVGNQYK
jgi:hypothetical protein